MDAYQRSARKTVIYPREHMVVYPALGLAGEAGEVCEKIKKVMRDSTHKSDFWDKMDDENEPTKKVILQNDTFAIFIFFDMKS